MKHKFRVDFELAPIVGYGLLWLVIIVVTLGLGSLVFGYYLPKTVVDSTYVLNETGADAGRLQCRLSIGEMIGQAVLWILLGLVTFGIALLFYPWSAMRLVLKRTEIVPV